MLEAEGLVEIKFRTAELRKLICRLDPIAQSLARSQASGAAADAAAAEAQLQARVQKLLPAFHAVALQYAAMHETPVRFTC